MIASAFSDLGFEVEVGPLFATPAETADMAVAKNVHMIGISTLAAGHLQIVPQLKAELDDILDQIDQVLEENAEDFVRNYVQKGGE